MEYPQHVDDDRNIDWDQQGTRPSKRPQSWYAQFFTSIFVQCTVQKIET